MRPRSTGWQRWPGARYQGLMLPQCSSERAHSRDPRQRTMTLTADLRGKTALVTGASSGLGRHFARVLVRAGAAVVLAARRLEALRELEEEIVSNAGRALAVRLDVCERRSVEEVIGTAKEAFGRIDILVNNSGVTATAEVLEHTEEDWDRVVDTNLKGAFLVAQAVARQLQAVGCE